jgi:NAD/NADP transhydrogenase beta subunit
MPSLVCLAAFAFLFALHRWSAARRPLAVLAAGLAPMAAALFAAIAISQRYTADFVPFLIATAAYGLAAFAALPRLPRRILYAFTSVLGVIALFITLAITLHYQGEGVWGVPDETRGLFLSLRQQFDAFLDLSHR